MQALPRIGVLRLLDLAAFPPRSMGERSSAVEPPDEALPPSVDPPPLLVVELDPGDLDRLRLHAGWLSLADQVVLLYSTKPEPSLQRRALVELMGNVALERTLPTDASAAQGEVLRCVETLRRLDTGRTVWKVHGQGAEGPPAASLGEECAESGRWVRLADAPMFDVQRFIIGGFYFDRGWWWLNGVTGERVNVVTGDRVPSSVQTLAAIPSVPLADGSGTLRGARRSASRQEVHWDAAGETLSAPAAGTPFGTHPEGSIAYVGGRCRFAWHRLSDRGPVLFSESTHEWPVAHARKLYGFEDNDPCYVATNSGLSLAVSVYGHDALVTGGLPLRWKNEGDLARAFRPVHQGCLYFTADSAPDAYPADPTDPEDEDARFRSPVVALGAGGYAVGAEAPLWRIEWSGAEAASRRLQGAEGGYWLFDSHHGRLGFRTGRLISGAGHQLWVVEGDALVCTSHGADGAGSVVDLGLAPEELRRLEGYASSRGDGTFFWLHRDGEVWCRWVGLPQPSC